MGDINAGSGAAGESKDKAREMGNPLGGGAIANLPGPGPTSPPGELGAPKEADHTNPNGLGGGDAKISSLPGQEGGGGRQDKGDAAAYASGISELDRLINIAKNNESASDPGSAANQPGTGGPSEAETNSAAKRVWAGVIAAFGNSGDIGGVVDNILVGQEQRYEPYLNKLGASLHLNQWEKDGLAAGSEYLFAKYKHKFPELLLKYGVEAGFILLVLFIGGTRLWTIFTIRKQIAQDRLGNPKAATALPPASPPEQSKEMPLNKAVVA